MHFHIKAYIEKYHDVFPIIFLCKFFSILKISLTENHVFLIQDFNYQVIAEME